MKRYTKYWFVVFKNEKNNFANLLKKAQF